MADALEVASHAYRLVLETDRVRVLEYRAAPRVKAEMHVHPDHVSVTMRGGRIRFTMPDGETAEAELSDGEVRFSGPAQHATENVGAGEIHVLIVELK